MFYYYAIKEDKSIYTLKSKLGTTLDEVRKEDKKVKYIVPINFLTWLKLSLKNPRK